MEFKGKCSGKYTIHGSHGIYDLHEWPKFMVDVGKSLPNAPKDFARFCEHPTV